MAMAQDAAAIHLHKQMTEDLVAIADALKGECRICHNRGDGGFESYLVVVAEVTEELYRKCVSCCHHHHHISGGCISDRIWLRYTIDTNTFIQIIEPEFYKQARSIWGGTWKFIW